MRELITKGMCGAEAILHVLRAMGVEQIFASPGSEWSPLWEYLAKPYGPGEIPAYLSARHEETAVGMAAGYAKVTGKLPAVIVHTTVGALHATMALREALHDRVPMVVLVGESIAFGERQGPDPGPQWLRLLAEIGGPERLVERCVKWSIGVNTSALVPGMIQRACQIAMAAPRGPVFLSVPMEFLFETMTSNPPAGGAYARPPAARPDAVDELARALAEAKNPVILTEEVGRNPRAVGHLVELAELLGAPVLECWHPGYLNFPRTHPLYGGVGSLEFLSESLASADLAFLVDVAVPWHPPSAAPGVATRVAVLSDDPLRHDMPFLGVRSDLAVTGEVEASLAMLVEKLRGLAGTRAAKIQQLRERHDRRRKLLAEEGMALKNHQPIDTRWVVRELNEVLPERAIVVDETITHRLEVHRFLDRLGPGCLLEASFGGLGMGLGTALGAKAAAPERPVIALIGDGAFNYNPVLAAFGVCQEHRLPILIVLFNNFGYLSQKSGIPQHYPEGWAVKSQTFVGTSILPSPDYAAIVRAFAGHGEKVEAPAMVRPALLRGLDAVANGQVALIDVTLDQTNLSGEV